MSPLSRRILLPACVIAILIFSLHSLKTERTAPARPSHDASFTYSHSGSSHPIEHLREQAEIDFQRLLRKQTHNQKNAAKAYEERRGRRPPPGFDKWLKFAKRKNAVIIEDFFDRIYADLAPFWATTPKLLRQQANKHHMRIEVRSGEVNIVSHYDQPWMDLWGDLVGTIARDLPDLTMAINDMDESRIIAPFEVVDKSMAVHEKTRKIVPKEHMKTKYSTSGLVDGVDPYPGEGDIWLHDDHRYWDLAVAGCSPKSPARAKHHPDFDFQKPLPVSGAFPDHSYKGYVANWTLAKSPCDYPILQSMHGSFVEPSTLQTTTKLIPMFGGSKLSINNDILLPPAMYWSDDERFNSKKQDGGSWDKKHDQLVWRGAGTGGRCRKENWTRFQRHRMVSMLNASTIALAEQNSQGLAPNFVLPNRKAWQLHAESLADWISSTADVGFGDMLCVPEPPETWNKTACEYNWQWFEAGLKMPLTEMLHYKYLPDVDGNSFSGRYRAFLASTSLPIKATVYDEWHDSRLIPWMHFVPMDNTFADLYGIMEYFLGTKGFEATAERGADADGHERLARDIALGGKAWAEKVLRREDMQVYVFRLLLEWARLLDDDRERLGWMPTGLFS